MHFVFEPHVPSVAVQGSDKRFPVHRIYCVGRNYADHAREMGANPEREAPFFFCKPADAVVANHSTLPFPPRTQDLHHEIELVVAIDKSGKDLTLEQAQASIFAYAVGLDLTRRDLQAQAKQQKRPWDTAKGFDGSAPLSALTPAAQIGWLDSGTISLSVNGEERQRGDISDLIWSVPEILVELSTLFCLRPGDLVFTGTPAGVGPINPGDQLLGCIAGLEPLHVSF